MKLNSAVLMLSILPLTIFASAYVTQQAYAEGTVKPMQIALFLDKECINPVSSISFGTVSRGESKSLSFWLKNQGPEKGRISWHSANFNPSSGGITETWERKVGKSEYIASWREKIKAGDVWEIRYALQVSQDAQVGMHSWDLIASFTTSHKVTSLCVASILTVTQ